ncbi:hypothetical protein [Crocosphaera chwakensis]|uniref:Uncharacterized protein n=1 Tax=Crocosphaera chwakensis CCY0110 TaxID=391612 RepID=A3IN60_9CHRO|nr:hypothetical protein [Crocosphaera chwakensis]EAZ92037.1 hypothetical protein CY0110_00225 [Crocosphaera chwakensis CCY0110]
MAKSIQKIRQEIEQLEQKSTEIFTELNGLYKRYLEALNISIKKQLILAAYQICTKIYPEEFLQLSYSQREKLQGNIRELCKPLESKLLAYISFPQPTPTATITEQILTQLSLINNKEFQLQTQEDDDSISEIKNPEDLVLWCQRVEQGIRMIINDLSQDVNQELQKNNIIASQLPPKLLDMALQAEDEGMSSGNAPNILNLLIETSNKDDNDDSDNEEDEEDSQESQITKISAINLRLSDIEFADPQLSIQRQHIRQKLEIIKKIRKAYQKIQRENAQAQAEAAWRSSWHE